MTIYYIQPQNGGLVKIGFTSKKVEMRIAELQTGCPDRLVLLGQESGDERKESELHTQFNYLRVCGEWFRPSIELMRHIVSLQESESVNVKILRAHARSYANCLWSHCMSERSVNLVNFLFNHAKYVSQNANECWNFLNEREVDEVCWKHCQYFFSLCWPNHKPWMELNKHVISKMVEFGEIKPEWIPDDPRANQRLIFNFSPEKP